MLLSVSTTHRPATDLGYLLHKHPDRVQDFAQSFGTATVLYPEDTEERCTAVLLLRVDPARLSEHVTDRSYAASSLLAVALADVFATARSGRCRSRQDLADAAIPLEIEIPVLPCRGGPAIARRLFEPLGWSVSAEPLALDDAHPTWGDSHYVHLRLTGSLRLADALNQLHVLLPVLDEAKHYWQADDEVDKLLRSGAGWLAAHPERELITRRYLARTGALVGVALARLAELDGEQPPGGEEDAPRRTPLRRLRHDAVLAALLDLGATSVIDLGCGPGAFVRRLVETPAFTRVAGCDVSARSLQQAAARLHLDRMGERQVERITLFQGALTYEDDRFAGYDAAVLMEVVEHVDPERLGALEHVVFGAAGPGSVLVTTPNADYNVVYETLSGMRHPDHRFEWTRVEFAAWAGGVATAYGYRVEIRGIGDEVDGLGAPTQLGVFTRE